MSTPDSHVAGESKQVHSHFARDFNTLFLSFTCHPKCVAPKTVINTHMCFSWPGTFTTMKSSLLFMWLFWGLLTSSFWNHLVWLLDVKFLGSKFSCSELGLVPQVNTNFSWLPFKSVFCYLSFSCLRIFCVLFYQAPVENSSQTGFSFLAVTVADLLFQTASTTVSNLISSNQRSF